MQHIAKSIASWMNKKVTKLAYNIVFFGIINFTVVFWWFYFQVSENLLSIYLDEYEETPWDALCFMPWHMG